MAWFGKNNRGRDVTLLNPHEKNVKYRNELQLGKKITVDSAIAKAANEKSPLVVKTKKSGKPITLSDTQKAFRAGYLKAQQEQADIFCNEQDVLPKRKLKKLVDGRESGENEAALFGDFWL